MTTKRLVQWTLALAGALAAAGCSGNRGGAPSETWAAIDAVPDGAQCVHVVAEGADAEQLFAVDSGHPALLHLDTLPATGAVSVVAYADSCDAVLAGSDSVPDWVADAAAVRVSAGGAGRVAVALHANHDSKHQHHCHGDHDGDGTPDGGTADGGVMAEAIRIEQVDYHGSGCAPGTVMVGLSPDHEAATVTFSEYTASAGVGVDPSELSKSCNLDFRFHVPQGRTVAVSTIDYRGFVHLDDNMKAAFKSRLAFKDGCNQDRDTEHFVGAMDTDYEVSDEVKASLLAWSPCGGKRTLDVDSAIAIDNSANPDGTGLLTVDSVDQEVKQTYHLQWKACH